MRIVRHVVDAEHGMEIMDVEDSHGRKMQFQCGILPGHPNPTVFFDGCIKEFAQQETLLKEHVKTFKPKTLAVMILLFLLAPFAKAAPTVTVSASAVTLLGTTQTISLTCTLIDPYNTGMLKVSGTGIVPITRTSTVTPGTTATVGPIYGNDVILNAFGVNNVTYYLVQVFTVTGGFLSSTPALQNFYAFTGSGTIDLSTATPLVPNFMNSTAGVSIPGNLSVSGNLSVTGTSALNGGGTTAGPFTHSGLHTFSAGLTSSGPNSLSGGGSLAGTYTGNPIFSGSPTFVNLSLTATTCGAGASGTVYFCSNNTSNNFPEWSANASGTQRLPFMVVIPTNQTNATTTLAPLGLVSYDPGPNVVPYTLTCHLFVQVSANTLGVKIGWMSNSTATSTFITESLQGYTAAAVVAYAFNNTNSYGNSVTLGNISAGSTTFEQDFSSSILISVTGALNLGFAATSAGTATILQGSYCSYQ